MKKHIICVLLAVVMILSCGALAACNLSSSDPGKEISLTVKDDSKTAEPQYSASLASSIAGAMISFIGDLDDFGMDREEIEDSIKDELLPLLSKAKISEANIKKIVKYFENNAGKFEDIAVFISSNEPPEDTYEFLTAYYALLNGVYEVLDADDVAKFVYVLLQDTKSPMYESEVASVVKDIGRDNFIIVSRFMFKLMGVSLQNQEDMIDLMTEVMNSVLLSTSDLLDPSEEYGFAMTEILELYIIALESQYRVYETITDNEINKLIEIFIDVYAAISKSVGETVSVAKKSELIVKYKALVADYRALVTFTYKAALRINPVIFEQEDGFFDLFNAMFDAYDKDITSSQKTTISNMLKAGFTDAQYYSENKVEEDKYLIYSYYDDVTNEYVEEYRIEYKIDYVKGAVKAFNAPSKLLSDPVGALKIFVSALKKDYEGKEDNFTGEEKEIYDFFMEYYNEVMMGVYGRFGYPTEGMNSRYGFEYYEERTPMEESE